MPTYNEMKRFSFIPCENNALLYCSRRFFVKRKILPDNVYFHPNSTSYYFHAQAMLL